MLEDEYLVAHDHAHEGDEAEQAGESQNLVGNEQAHYGARHAQADGHDADDGNGELAEVEQQEEEDEHHGHAQACHYVGGDVVVLLRLSSHLGTHSPGQGHLADVVDDAVLYVQGKGSALALGGYGDATLAVAVHYLGVPPSGSHAGHLSQRHGGPGGRTQVGVVHIAEGHLFGGTVLENQRHLVGTALAVHAACLPDGTNLHLARLEHELQFGRGARYAQLAGGYGVQRDFHKGRGTVIVGMHPFQFRNGAHLLHEHVGRLLYGVYVVAIETVLIGGHGQIVHLLPAHVGARPVVAVLGSQFVQQFQRGLYALRVYDELGEVLARYDWSVGHVEAR